MAFLWGFMWLWPWPKSNLICILYLYECVRFLCFKVLTPTKMWTMIIHNFLFVHSFLCQVLLKSMQFCRKRSEDKLCWYVQRYNKANAAMKMAKINLRNFLREVEEKAIFPKKQWSEDSGRSTTISQILITQWRIPKHLDSCKSDQDFRDDWDSYLRTSHINLTVSGMTILSLLASTTAPSLFSTALRSSIWPGSTSPSSWITFILGFACTS